VGLVDVQTLLPKESEVVTMIVYILAAVGALVLSLVCLVVATVLYAAKMMNFLNEEW
jgi:hypothetical protein